MNLALGCKILVTKNGVMCLCDWFALIGYCSNHQGHVICYSHDTPPWNEYCPQGHGRSMHHSLQAGEQLSLSQNCSVFITLPNTDYKERRNVLAPFYITCKHVNCVRLVETLGLEMIFISINLLVDIVSFYGDPFVRSLLINDSTNVLQIWNKHT